MNHRRPDRAASAAVQLASRLPDQVAEEDRAPLLPLLALVRGSVALHQDHPLLLWCGSTLARRLGAAEEAVAWARHSFAVEPSHEAAVMTGYALRSAGRTAEALQVWQDETRRFPEDLSLYIDIADLLVVEGDLAQALAWAERAAELDPAHPKAEPTALGIRYRVDGDVGHLLELAASDLPYAATTLESVSWDRPVLGRATDQTEATANSLGQLLEQAEPSPDLAVTVAVSAVEPPSAVLALHLAFPKADITFESVPEPDPRAPRYPVRHAVWTYDGTTAHPAVPPPSPVVAEAVRQAAAFRWACLPALHSQTAHLASADPTDLLGTLVHPPAVPDTELGAALARHAPNLWLAAVQVTACLGIAHHAVEQPWPDSRRREVLLDLLHGVEDWTTVAAGIALVATAWVDPDTRPDVKHHVVSRMVDAAKANQNRVVTILGPLCELVLATPETEVDFTGPARDLLVSLED
ncbi:MAG: tetratricopeptide repeat protein [Umezawaea sp.]